MAEREWQANRFQRAEQILDESPHNLRQWEWYYLKRLCHSELQTFRGHASNIVSAAFDSDGRSLMSISADGALMQWNLATGLRSSLVQVWTNGINKAAFSKNGSRLIIDGENDDFVRVWDVMAGKELFAIKPPGSDFHATSVAISAKGDSIAVAISRKQSHLRLEPGYSSTCSHPHRLLRADQFDGVRLRRKAAPYGQRRTESGNDSGRIRAGANR